MITLKTVCIKFFVFLNKLEKQIIGFLIFLFFANCFIFLYEWNEGRMVKSDPSDKEFVVKSVQYGIVNGIYVQEKSGIGVIYRIDVNLTKKELTKLKVKKGRVLVINTTLSENNVGKQRLSFNKIKFNRQVVYTLQHE